MAKTLPGILAWSAIVLVECTVAGAIPEYSAAEAAKHIGQKAIVTGVVQDVVQSRAHLHLELGGTPGKPDLYVFVPSFGDTDIFPDYFQYRGATIAVSGKIERRSGYLGINVTDPSQITSKTEGLPGHFYIGYMKQKRGDLNGAIAEYDRVIELDNKNAEAYRARASAKAEKGDADAAIADYGRYIELVPNDGNSYGARAGLRFRRGDFDGAIADYSRIIQIFPKAAPYNDRADVKKAKGDLVGAIADYETALRFDPSNKTYKANLQRAQIENNRKQPLTRAQPAPQPVASMAPSPRTVSKPATAEIVDIAVGLAEQGIKAGNVRVIYEDGHVVTMTYACNYMQPHVSSKGDVGWLQFTGFDRKGYALNDKIVVCSSDGRGKEFKPPAKAPFIGEWNFAADGSAIVIQSMSFHGPQSYIRYDLATGRKTNEKIGRNDSEPLPEWARPVAKTLPEYSPAEAKDPLGDAKGRDGDHARLPLAAQQTEQVASTTQPGSPQSSLAGANILGSPAEPGIATVTALVEFTGNGAINKGSRPNGLIFCSDGDIYGTTENGGANDFGTVFKMTPAGALTTLVEFAGHAPANSSGFPTAPLVEARGGNFYGTTSGGGIGVNLQNILDNGTVFELSRSGVLTTLVRFSCSGPTNKGCTPYAGLVQAPNGDFYGTTFSGGSEKKIPIPGFHGFGTAYKMSPAGQLTTVYDFSAHLAKGQGGAPWAGLILGNDGNFYGTTWNGLGIAGSVFKLTPTGTMTPLVKFSGPKPPNKGGGCVAELIQASDGNFYGTTPVLGTDLRGTIFKMTPGGVLTNLVEFHDNDSKGAAPKAPLIEGNDGNLYGTTISGGAFGWGTIFQVTPSGSFRTLWNFNNPNKIHDCDNEINGALLKDKEGNFYGTTKGGGRSDWGTVFKLTLHDSGSSTRPLLSSPATVVSPPATTKSTSQIVPRTSVVTESNIQAAQNEQFSNKNKDEVSPESIAEAFVQAYSGADVDAVAGLYADRVDHTNSGVISNATVRAQAKEYFARWPVRQWSLVGPVKTTSMGPSRQKVIFSASYDASNPKANIHASGVAQETLILATDQTGGIKIVSQKERTSKRDSSQPDEKTSGDFGLKAAKTEYDTSSRDEAARIRYVTKLAGMLGKGMQYWWRTHDKMGGPNLDGVEEELIKHPMPRNVDSRKLTPLLIGKWASPRHVYVFRADGTYGVADEQRDKWRIDRNEYIDDVSRGPIILLDRNYFIYAEGEGLAFYMRANDSEAERNQSANTNTQNAAEEVNSTFNGAGDKADGEEKLFSPDKSYSVEIMRGYGLNSSALVLFNGTQELARIPAEVGPVGSFFEALWSPDGKYVAINKQRSSRPGGDEMWIVALPTGKVLRQPDDAPWDELYEKADAFIAEKGLNETGGKEFLTLIAISWEKDRLRLRLEAGFSETEDRYFFEGTVDPLHLKTIADWKVSKTKS